MLKIGLKSAFLDRVVNKCSDYSMIEIRGISLILFCSRVFVLSLLLIIEVYLWHKLVI